MFSMAMADLLGATFWFIDMLHSMCPLNLVLNLYGYQAGQLWSCIMGLYLILKFSGRRIPPEFIFHLAAWGLPFIPQGFILALQLYSAHPPPQGCWIAFGNTELVVVAIPQLITVVLNLFFIGFICFYRRKDASSRWGFRTRDQSLFFIQIWCFVTAFASILQSVPNAPSIVYDISYVLGAAQGLFNSLAMRQTMVLRFFTWTNTQIVNVRNSLTAPHLLVNIDSSGPIAPYTAQISSSNQDQDQDQEQEQGQHIAPTSALFIHPHGTYTALPVSDIN